MSQRIRGVLAPVVTPFKQDLSLDRERFIAHCRWLLSQNCGLAVFGTNSEANSLSMEERAMLLESHVGCSEASDHQLNAVLELKVGDAAHVDHVKITGEGAGALHVSTLMAAVGAHARFNEFLFTTGGGVVRNPPWRMCSEPRAARSDEAGRHSSRP